MSPAADRIIEVISRNGNRLIWLVAGLAALRLVALGVGEMQQWDEAIYALRTEAVLRFGAIWDQAPWLPSGAYYAAHPPLYPWLSALFVPVFGSGVWVYRLTAALAAGAVCLLTLHLGRRLATPAVALASALAVTASPLLFEYSREGQLDTLLTLTLLAACAASLSWIHAGRIPSLLAGALALGAALMTKTGLALSLPVALAVLGVLESGEIRKRALQAAVMLPVLSAPVWAPWLIGYVMSYTGGDVLRLFSADTPLGRTLAGGEGTVKDTGMLYYLNQIVVHGSILFPALVVGLISALRGDAGWMYRTVALFALVWLMLIHLASSRFEAYLVPLVPCAALLALHALRELRRWSNVSQSLFMAGSIISLAWSLSLELRVAVKRTLMSVTRLVVPDTSDLLLVAALGCVITAGVWVAVRRLRSSDADSPVLTPAMVSASVALVLTVAFLRAHAMAWWGGESGIDGAQEAVESAGALGTATVVFVGNGDNPQLTWYADGRDAGWHPEETTRWLRLEPRVLGASAIATRIGGLGRGTGTAVIVEKDEIAAGMVRAARDVLPAHAVSITTTRRYDVYLVRDAPSR